MPITCSLCTNWSSYTIKRQLLLLHGSLITLSLFVVWAILFSYVYVVSEQIITTLHDDLQSSILEYALYIVEDNSQLFANIMNSSASGCVVSYGILAGLCQNSQYNFAQTPAYFEYGTTYLAQPLTYDTRQNDYVSLTHSAYYAPYSYPNNISQLSQTATSIINITTHIDDIAITAYQQYINFVALYAGFDDSGVFFSYPGKSTLVTDPTRSYDPRIRGWYTQAKMSNAVIYTDPYQDFHSKEWMITIAMPIVANGIAIGVVGGDMLIDAIRGYIDSIVVLDTGRATLYTSSGIVIADNQWQPSPTSTTQFTYSDLQSPQITPATWALITSSPQGIYPINEYQIIVKKIQLNQQSYYLTLTLLQSEIYAPLNDIIGNIQQSRAKTMIIVSVVSVIVIILTIIVVIWMSNDISNSLQEMCKKSERIIANIGKDNIADDVSEAHLQSNYYEVQQTRNKFNQLIAQLKGDDQNVVTGLVINECYNPNVEPYVSNYV